MLPGAQRAAAEPAAAVAGPLPAPLAAAVAFAFAVADPVAFAELAAFGEPVTFGEAAGISAGTVAARWDAEGDGLTAVHAWPYAREGSEARDSRAAIDACAAAVLLADGLGPPLPKIHPASIRAPNPPPRMKNRRRQ